MPLDLSLTRADLADLFARLGFRSGAEVGVERGHFSRTICKANPGVTLICVDPWEAYPGYRDHVAQDRLDRFHEETRERLRPFGCIIRRAFSLEAACEIPNGSLDFVYLDANHSRAHVEADIEAWAPKVRVGGIVSGHDYCAGDGYGVIEAVNAYVRAHDIHPLFILRGDRSPSWAWVA